MVVEFKDRKQHSNSGLFLFDDRNRFSNILHTDERKLVDDLLTVNLTNSNIKSEMLELLDVCPIS